MGLDLTFDNASQKKRVCFKTNWQHAKLDTCLADMFDADNNAIAILTGECSDVLAIDLDRPKAKDLDAGLQDAVDRISALILQNGMDVSVPTARTPSGGIHMLFRLSSTLAAGLISASNGTKLANMTLDVRGDRGCLLCHPSQCNGKQYIWERPIVPVVDLPPAPAWLIHLLNQRSHSTLQTIQPAAKKRRTLELDADCLLKAKVQHQLTKMGPSLQMATTWPRLNGIDFCLQDRTCSCPLCGNVHSSNQYTARVLIDSAWLMSNYSTSCRSQAFGWAECSLLKQLIASPNTDDSFCHIMHAVYIMQHRTIKFTAANRFLSHNGIVWEEIHMQTIKQDVKALISQVITPLICNIPKTEDNLAKVKALSAARKFIERAHNVNSIIQTFQTYSFDARLEDDMDTDRDLLAVSNGVIDLPTGSLIAGKGSQKLSIHLTTAFHDQPTPIIDAFFHSVFNGDPDTIAYVQRLLGYGITGHTRQQVWAIWSGTGSNGKSLLMQTLMRLLGPFAVAMPGEVLFESGKTAAGACTPHLQCLIKKRMGFKDEGRSDKANVLNEELIKNVTGSTPIATKPHYKEMISFLPSHLPILLCNKRPHVNIRDDAMMRRVVVIPFDNVYTTLDSKQIPYDAANPRHRLADQHLEERLMSQDGQEQLLTWLVRGAASWYQDGLGRMPASVSTAFDGYREENDHLAAFINECCLVGKDITCNAGQFRQALIAHSGLPVKQKDLRDQMAAKGFKFATKTCTYKGLHLATEECKESVLSKTHQGPELSQFFGESS